MSLKKILRPTSTEYLGLILIANAVAGISVNYYFSTNEPLRTLVNLGDCRTEKTAKYCQEKCGSRHVCLLGQCLCVEGYTISEDGLVIETEEFSVETEVTEKSLTSPEGKEGVKPTKKPQNLDKESENPALRHHIAHFCPNLDVARQCIYKCLKVGKPAFCGKNHVCSCGHVYDYPVKDQKIDINATYNQFRDLYEKYFGPQDTSD
uniref:Uncharacterized protein n=1 Tax=Heliothis virescens TaxID=7102 RepID=A0A2A4J165_HELVI